MSREQRAEVFRGVSQRGDDRPLVMGSQAILGTDEEDVLPPAATVSMEAETAFLSDEDRAKADLVTAAIGEDFAFHQLRGYYAEGIHVEAAPLPEGWRDSLITQPLPGRVERTSGRPHSGTPRRDFSGRWVQPRAFDQTDNALGLDLPGGRATRLACAGTIAARTSRRIGASHRHRDR
ncbi:hypothetical protein D0Z08_10170 [Nocardioides immobilis]|uniref:Uncharacterized protein n=1 Tax=Nocardioides immobilis TaxID=2049295 RepID=A0A417Y3C5_9ACTN|nr:hypothetical protein [Nocardioides immobilis]RHW27034.1 hypothetical protein D0Z08_10170 [Nocardioides immobilis]